MKSVGLLVRDICCKGRTGKELMVCQDAGYNYVNVDDCYAEKERSPAGDIVESA